MTSIKAKLILLSVVILLLITGMIAAGIHGMTRIERQGQVSLEVSELQGSLHKMLQGLSETVVIPDTPETLALAHNGIESFDAGLVRLQSLIDDPDLLKIIEEQILPVWQGAKTESQTLLAKKRLNPDDVEVMIAFGRLSVKCGKLLNASQDLGDRSDAMASREVVLIKALLGLAAIGVVATAMLFLYFFYRSLVGPLRALSDSARSIGEGNLTLVVDTHRQDELGDVARSFTLMTSNLAKTIHKTSEINDSITEAVSTAAAVTREVAEAVRIQREGVEQSVSSVDELYRSYESVGGNIDALNAASVESANAISTLSSSLVAIMRDAQDFFATAMKTVGEVRGMIETSTLIADGVDGLKRFSSDSLQTIGMIDESLGSTRKNAEEAMTLADRVSRESMEIGVASVRSALEGMGRLEENVLALTESVHGLGEKSAEIGKIVTVIDEITTQTRLLALNASIIAAQAGEHGKGFAVVAEEIRALADRTSMSTREISQVVSFVQVETMACVERAREGEASVKAGKSLVSMVSENLETIAHSANLSAVKVADILEAANTEAAGIVCMTRSVADLNAQIATITDRVRQHQRGNSEILVVLEAFMAKAADIRETTIAQQASGDSIAIAARQVADLSRQIIATIAEQKTTTDYIIDVIHTLNASAGRLSATTDHLAANIAPLAGKAESLSAEIHHFRLNDTPSPQP